MPSALTAHERAVLKRQIRPHRFARAYKWTKYADQIPASVKRPPIQRPDIMWKNFKFT